MSSLEPSARSRRPRHPAKARPAPAERRASRAAHPPELAPAARVRAALQDPAHVERLSRMFRALGDPTRSKLVFALSLGELCVSDLAGALGATLSATSHQLRILRDLDIVHVRRAGKSQFYSLNEAAFGFCSPRVCQAWKSALATDSLVRPGVRRAEG